MTTAVLMHTAKHFSAFKRKSAPSARSAFAFIVGLNRYYLLMVAIMIMMLVIVIVPISITVPAVAFHIPPLVGVPPAVFPSVM